MAQLQHWIVNCTTCDSPAEYHCNTCGDILCPRCREIHQRSRATGHHSIVPYTERIEPGKLIGHCDDHLGNQCILWCQRCDKAVCTLCVTSPDHEGHIFVQMASKVDERRKVIQEEFSNYSKLLKTWEDSLQQIQTSMKTCENDFDELGKEITKAADRVCGQVRSVEAELQKQLQEMRKLQTRKFQDQVQALLEGISGIKQQIKEAEDKLRSEDVGVLLHYRALDNKGKIEEPPERDPLTLPVFKSGKTDIQSIETMVGYLFMIEQDKDTEEGVGNSQMSQFSPRPVPASSMMTLLPSATVMSTLETSKDCTPYLACGGSGQAWVRTGKDRIQLVDKQGTVKKTINTGFITGSIAITPNRDLLIADYGAKSVKSASEAGSIQTLFRTKWEPWGICSLHNEDVLVAFRDEGRVVQYSRDGRVVRELDNTFFKHPRNVAQNRSNNHVYLVDKYGNKVDSIGKLLAFNIVSGKLEFDYTGLDRAKFTPCGLCTDQAGHVIITDWRNDRIHILGRDGRFLQYLLTKDQGLFRPSCIDTDTDGYAWISEYKYKEKSQVKILKYMKYD